MRLDDMLLVHPQMDRDHICSKCLVPVGIYPSGQRVLQQYRKVTIICQVCQPNALSFGLAPGALSETQQSHWR